VPETRTVTFFLSFPDPPSARALVETASRRSTSSRPTAACDAAWSPAAEGELGRADLGRAVARLRAIAAATGGTLEGAALPWPGQAGA
jgi:hypothetical protein